MPLERAKDSFLDLLDLQAEWEKKAKAGGINSEASLEWFEDEESTFWEPPKDPRAFERILLLNKPHKEKYCCFPCFSPSQQDEGVNNNEIWRNEREQKQSRSDGIIRRASLAVQVFLGLPNAIRKSFHPVNYNPRSSRNLNLRVEFAPQIRVVTIKPLSCMSTDEKRSIWWQFTDFEAFQISSALLIKSKEANGKLCEAWLTDMAGFVDETPPNDADSDDSWWHKYQHSRRGLERFASEESHEIQRSYQTAVQVVLQEQMRQKIWHRRNPEKLAQLYHEYTVWSRDLALAAGASDADAVLCNFDDSTRKSREYFLLKQLLARSKGHEFAYEHTPAFMLPSGTKAQGLLGG